MDLVQDLKDFVYLLAHEPIEMSQDKILWQLRDYKKRAAKLHDEIWQKENGGYSIYSKK